MPTKNTAASTGVVVLVVVVVVVGVLVLVLVVLVVVGDTMLITPVIAGWYSQL